MPATGTPEPGGLFWDETLMILKNACKISDIIGVDINELAPIKTLIVEFLVAKLAYKILSYIFEYKRVKILLHPHLTLDYCTLSLSLKNSSLPPVLSNKVFPRNVPNPVPALSFTNCDLETM